MKFIICLFVLLTLTSQPYVVDGGQIALRPRPKEALLSRSFPSNNSLFDPTDEEYFYTLGGETDENSITPLYNTFLINPVFIQC